MCAINLKRWKAAISPPPSAKGNEMTEAEAARSAAATLEEYNAWRRGGGGEMPDTAALGVAIDEATRFLRSYDAWARVRHPIEADSAFVRRGARLTAIKGAALEVLQVLNILAETPTDEWRSKTEIQPVITEARDKLVAALLGKGHRQ